MEKIRHNQPTYMLVLDKLQWYYHVHIRESNGWNNVVTLCSKYYHHYCVTTLHILASCTSKAVLFIYMWNDRNMHIYNHEITCHPHLFLRWCHLTQFSQSAFLGRLPTFGSRPNTVGGKLPSVRTSVCPSVHKTFLRFRWNLVYR